MTISNMTLVKIASVGGLATITMGILLQNKIDSNIKATNFYKDALKLLRSHKGAVHLLGEPIKDRMIDVGNEKKNFCKENIAQYEVKVRGPKQKGVLYFSAKRKDPESSWNVHRVELELANDASKRLVIKSSSPD